MKVLKFGGSSVGSPQAIRQVLSILKSYEHRSSPLPVVVSAFEKVTDTLIRTAETAASGDVTYREKLQALNERHFAAIDQLFAADKREATVGKIRETLDDLADILHGVFLVRDLSKRTLDFVMSFGERLSAQIIAAFGAGEYGACEYVDTRDLIVSDENFGSAHVDFAESNRRIGKFFEGRSGIFIVTGFIAASPARQTTTLGRGGSDYTAAILGAALQAEQIEIWTDVDGVLTADPRKVRKAFSLPSLTYPEAMELSHFGAKVIYPPTIQPARDRGIPVVIKNTFNPAAVGTIIGASRADHGHPITGISSISDTAILLIEGSGMVGVAGTSRRLFEALQRESINVILITQASSEHSICLAVEPGSAERARAAIEREFGAEMKLHQIDSVGVEYGRSIVAIVGENMRNTPGIAGRMFQALGKNGVNIVAIAQGSSELNISAAIAKSDEPKALNALHDAFFLSDTKTVNLFLIGSGLVGSALLEQLMSHRAKLRSEHRLELNLAALANSKKMLVAESGIALDGWKEALERGEASDLDRFIESIRKLNLPNSIFVDCTASAAVAARYAELLQASISIVTPNKRANSSSLEEYRRLRSAARRANVKFFYETNVGAGLPVINTLNDLGASGDEIVRIEAVLSGTLSYIFNTFCEGRSFSEVVKEAKARGYTEPDPRDDLSGQDVARKLLILAREIGFELEESDIAIEPFLPRACFTAQGIDGFFRELERIDAEFEQRRKQASGKGEALRYIGRIENGRASVSLQSVDTRHPFYSLSGSDNIISFTTKRYSDRPLVVKGPGAGTAVTAAGVFADIVRAASYLG